MNIHYLVAIAILALILVLAGPTMRVLRYIAEVHEAKQRRRHAVRRRERARGYLPVHDEQWNPAELRALLDSDPVFQEVKRLARGNRV